MTDKEELGASLFSRSIDLMEDDPLEEIFALNLGDFISEYLISEDLANKIGKDVKDKTTKLKSQLKEEQPSELSLTIISNYMAGGISQLFRYWIKNRDSVSREMLRKDVSFATDIALWHMK